MPDALSMTIQPNTSQRDLVRLSILLCGGGQDEKRPATDGGRRA